MQEGGSQRGAGGGPAAAAAPPRHHHCWCSSPPPAAALGRDGELWGEPTDWRCCSVPPPGPRTVLTCSATLSTQPRLSVVLLLLPAVRGTELCRVGCRELCAGTGIRASLCTLGTQGLGSRIPMLHPCPTVPPLTYPDLRVLFFTQGGGSILTAISYGGAEAGGEQENPARYRGPQHCPLPTCLCPRPGCLPPPLPPPHLHGRLNPAPAPPCPQAAPADDTRPLGPPAPHPPPTSAPHPGLTSSPQCPSAPNCYPNPGSPISAPWLRVPLGGDGHGRTDGCTDRRTHKHTKQTHGRTDLTPSPLRADLPGKTS